MTKEQMQRRNECMASIKEYFDQKGYMPEALVDQLWQQHNQHFHPICKLFGRETDPEWLYQIPTKIEMETTLKAAGKLQEPEDHCRKMIKDAYQALEDIIRDTSHSLEEAICAINLRGLAFLAGPQMKPTTASFATHSPSQALGN
jgi:hypothetical protein